MIGIRTLRVCRYAREEECARGKQRDKGAAVVWDIWNTCVGISMAASGWREGERVSYIAATRTADFAGCGLLMDCQWICCKITCFSIYFDLGTIISCTRFTNLAILINCLCRIFITFFITNFNIVFLNKKNPNADSSIFLFVERNVIKCLRDCRVIKIHYR